MPLRGAARDENWLCASCSRAQGDDVDEGPERCRSAERYSRSAGACEPKDIRAAQRVGGEGSFWLQVLRGQSSPRPKTYDPTPSRVPSSTSRTRAASAYGVNGFR